jgi:NCS1 family nucleobase:cation symporter-1
MLVGNGADDAEGAVPMTREPETGGRAAADHPHRLADLDLPPISPRLYNQDLAPTMRAGRRWSAYNIFTLWANDVHSLATTPS